MPTNAAPSIHRTQQRDTRNPSIDVIEGVIADATQVAQTTATITYAPVDPGGPKIGRFDLLVPAPITGSLTLIVQTARNTPLGPSANWRTVATFQTLTGQTAPGPSPGVVPAETCYGFVDDFVRVVATPGQGGGQSATYQVFATFK